MLLMIFSLIMIAISLVFFVKGQKTVTFLSLGLAFVFPMSEPGWYITMDSDVYLALACAVISSLIILLLSIKKDKAKNVGFSLLIVFMLWFCLFIGTRRANEVFSKQSEDRIIKTEAIDIKDKGAERVDIPYYLGYRDTMILCNIDGTEFEVTVPGNSVEKLSVGDKFFVGVNDGALGLKYFHVIFDENYYVATEIPQKQTEGRYKSEIMDPYF